MSTLSAKEYKRFEDIKRIRPDGSEYWAARELAPVLDYAKWENFYKVIKRAMIACENSGRSTLECFPEVRKTSPMPNGGVKDILDYELSRYACYLIVQNGDPRKEVIALGQTYFAIQTYRQEVADRFNQLDEDSRRLVVRGDIKQWNQLLAETARNAGVITAEEFAIFQNAGYMGLYGYATTVGSCWLAPLVEAGEGVNMSFLVKRQSKEKILSKIAQTTMVNRSRMRDVGDTRQDYEELDSAINSGLYLKDVMNRQGEDFYYMHTLIEVTAPDPETLEQRATEVEKLCVSVDMIARRCDYKNEQAFLSSLPILALDPDIERKARRNALTSGVAAAFPFASYELSDHNGIFLGLNLYNRSPVFLDPYDDYKYTNGNWWIGGSTGAGKTVTLQCLGGRLRQQGKRVIIIAPKKGHEFRPLCEKLGGLYLRMSPSSKDCPNLMAIRRKSLDSYAKLKNIAARDDSVLADKISQLIIWFALKKKDLSEEDKSRLDSSLVEVYGRYGITFDNSSIVDENGDFRTMPIISDWYDVLSQNPDTRYLSVVLSRYVTGSAAAMASRNNIDLDNKYIVLDLSGMPDDMIADGTFWATSIAYDLIMSCESDLSALLADELWSLVGATANPQAAGFVLEMVKTIRGLGGIAVTSTQGMQDLFGLDGGSYGKGILDASRIKLVMQMEEQEARLIQDKLNLSEDEVRQITRFRRGEGLLCIGYNHVPVAFHTTPKEYEAITTSPTDLRRGRSEYGDE